MYSNMISKAKNAKLGWLKHNTGSPAVWSQPLSYLIQRHGLMLCTSELKGMLFLLCLWVFSPGISVALLHHGCPSSWVTLTGTLLVTASNRWAPHFSLRWTLDCTGEQVVTVLTWSLPPTITIESTRSHPRHGLLFILKICCALGEAPKLWPEVRARPDFSCAKWTKFHCQVWTWGEKGGSPAGPSCLGSARTPRVPAALKGTGNSGVQMWSAEG